MVIKISKNLKMKSLLPAPFFPLPTHVLAFPSTRRTKKNFKNDKKYKVSSNPIINFKNVPIQEHFSSIWAKNLIFIWMQTTYL